MLCMLLNFFSWRKPWNRSNVQNRYVVTVFISHNLCILRFFIHCYQTELRQSSRSTFNVWYVFIYKWIGINEDSIPSTCRYGQMIQVFLDFVFWCRFSRFCLGNHFLASPSKKEPYRRQINTFHAENEMKFLRWQAGKCHLNLASLQINNTLHCTTATHSSILVFAKRKKRHTYFVRLKP